MVVEEIEDTWLLNDEEQLSNLQSNAESLNASIEHVVEKIEEELERLKHDSQRREGENLSKLLQSFESRWLAKCKETENLRMCLSRASHESTRINYQYHDMENSVSKMREQFSEAIDSSVTEIEELAICNNSLSIMIQNLEDKMNRGEKAHKKNARANQQCLQDIIAMTTDTCTIENVRESLEKEVDRIDRMIVVEDLFAVDEMNTSLTEKSQKMVDAISQGLVETLKRELKECRQIVASQRDRVKGLEREKEEFLAKHLKSKEDEEMNGLLEALKRSFVHPTVDIILHKDFKRMKQLMSTLLNGIGKTHKSVASKTNQVIELKEETKYLEEQTKSHASEIEALYQEKEFLKTKVQQIESEQRMCNEELNALNSKLRAVEREKNGLLEENEDLKNGNESEKDYYSNLNKEIEKLNEKLKCTQRERDDFFADLHEQIQKCNACLTEKCELENKCKNFEHALTQMKREFQEHSRETGMVTRENEELKMALEDKDHERMKLKRNMKSIETGNKDLEDQIYQLNNENQRYKKEVAKFKQDEIEHQESMERLSSLLEKISGEKNETLGQLNELQASKDKLENNFTDFKIATNEDENDKGEYKELALKIAQYLQDLLGVCRLKSKNTPNCAGKDIKVIALKSEDSYKVVRCAIEKSQMARVQYENFVKELSACMSTETERDSCYSTEGDDLVVIVPGKDLCEERKGLDALKASYVDNSEMLSRLLRKARKFTKESLVQTQKTTNSTKQIMSLKKRCGHLKKKAHAYKSERLSVKKKLFAMRKQQKLRLQKEKETLRRESLDVLTNMFGGRRLTGAQLKQIIHGLEWKTFERLMVDDILKEEGMVLLRHEGNTTKYAVLSMNKLEGGNRENMHEVSERMEALGEERQYMMDHMLFTNKRLEVLLNCLKGNKEVVAEKKSVAMRFEPTQRVLNRVRHSFQSGKAGMETAVNILELTKAISITDLTELSENKAIDEDHLQTIVLVKEMNENMETVLREARDTISSRRLPRFEERNTEEKSIDKSIDRDEVAGKSEFVKKENELKQSLENANKKLEDLSLFLDQREAELRERDKVIANLTTDYELLKKETEGLSSVHIETRDRIIDEYKLAKEKLEKQNEHLQLVVRELRDELLTFQRTYRKEEEIQVHLQEFISELQHAKTSSDQVLDKLAYDLNIANRERDHLLRVVREKECFCHDLSESTFADSFTTPLTDDDLEYSASFDGYESLPDDEIPRPQSSTGSHTTASRVARTVRTQEVSESIKSQNRPSRYYDETRTHTPLRSPRHKATRANSVTRSDHSTTHESEMSARVRGRREEKSRRMSAHQISRDNNEDYMYNEQRTDMVSPFLNKAFTPKKKRRSFLGFSRK